MVNKVEEIKRLENCRFCRAGLSHICKDDHTHEMPKALTDFGSVSKAVQSNPKEEDMDKPYWASSHEYDDTVKDWESTRLLLQNSNSQDLHITLVSSPLELQMQFVGCQLYLLQLELLKSANEL